MNCHELPMNCFVNCRFILLLWRGCARRMASLLAFRRVTCGSSYERTTQFFSFWNPFLFQKRVAKQLAENLADFFCSDSLLKKIGRKIGRNIGRKIGKEHRQENRQEHRQDNRCVLNIDCLVLFARLCFLCKTIRSAHRQTRCENLRRFSAIAASATALRFTPVSTGAGPGVVAPGSFLPGNHDGSRSTLRKNAAKLAPVG